MRLTFAIPRGERVFLRSSFDKAEPVSTPEKGTEDVKADFDTQPEPVISSWNDKQLKYEDPESQLTNATSNGEEMKLDTDQAPQEIPPPSSDEMNLGIDQAPRDTPASSNVDEMKLDNDQAPHEIPTSSTDEMNIDTVAQPVIPPSDDEATQQETPFSVVIFSPGGTRKQKPKRTIPEPKPQPPMKRKRGRPPKKSRKQPEPESPREPEVSREIEVSQRDEQSPTAPVSFMDIVAAQIEENCKAATAAPSDPKPSQPESPLSVLSSTHEAPEILDPELSASVEESSIADTNGKSDKAESLKLSTAQFDTPVDSVEAPVESPVESPIEPPVEPPVEARQDKITKPPSTEPQNNLVPTPSQATTSEPDEIIVPNLSSPQALVHKILQIDGRMPNGRTANAWKEIRCYRNNQDMGSLFDVREAWFLQQ